MSKKFLIVTPEYNENGGGTIALHKLCHLLNNIGHEAYLHPHTVCRVSGPGGRIRNIWSGLTDDIELLKFRFGRSFKTNPAFNTPILRHFDKKRTDEWIVVYADVITGNPFRAKNIVRWFLHQPGYFSKIVCYGRGELYYKYSSNIKDFFIDGSKTSQNLLEIWHYLTEYYNTKDVAYQREGVAYCVRKGRNKPRGDLPEDAINIDGLSHQQISDIFKKIQTFISYDDYTAYSKFALMCGCDSVVIPSQGITEDTWYPDISDRYGIAYGWERLDWARETAPLQLKKIEQLMNTSQDAAAIFAQEANEFFSTPRDMGYISQLK